jgi:hypothetical protein
LRFHETTREQADEYFRFAVQSEPWRLRDLAERMRATGGPLESMDGSYGSLIPLWRWLVSYADAGFPGVGPQEIPSWWPTPVLFEDDTPDKREALEGLRLAGVASEGISYYLRLVLERETGAAPWFVHVWKGRDTDQLHHRTLVEAGDGRIHDLWVARIARGAAEQRAPSRVERRLLATYGPRPAGEAVVEGPFGASVLAPYLDLDPALEPPEVRVSPVVSWSREWWPAQSPDRRRAAASAAPVRVEPVGEDMTLAAGPAEGLEVPAMLDPLDGAEVAQAVTAAGFVGPTGRAVLPGDLVGEDVQLGHRDDAALLQVLSWEGTVRALHLEPGNPDAAGWARIVSALGELAARRGARFVPDDAF